MSNINDLPQLKNIINDFNIPNLINESDENDIIESVLTILDTHINEFIKIYHNGCYKDDLYDLIYNEVENLLEDHYLNDDLDYYVNDLTNKVLYLFFHYYPKRSLKTNKVVIEQNEEYKKLIDKKLDLINKKDESLPEQRTKEWYEARYNLLSASSAWKCLDKQNYKNNIIFEKCEPLNTEKYNYVNVNTPFHWGQKYEPVAQMYYEYEYNAEIREYGCIPHSKYDFLGASPDGINIKRDNERYGRLLEIKNIYNREINGIPKKEYWIQTQLQMECCDLNECDFLECLFIEYENEEEFLNDGCFKKTKDGKYKGMMIQYFKDNKPFYEYAPFQCSKEEFEVWYENTMKKNEEISWIKNIYWKLEKISCVLIQRNRVWFENVVEELREVWETIKQERVTGHHHRKPTKKNKQINIIKKNNDDKQKEKKPSPLIINIDI